MITILGPTATGKTSLATQLAKELNGEIISADSRQVYRGMDIGTGKDLSEYTLDDTAIPYHLIDIVEPGYEYNVYEYQRDFIKAYEDIIARHNLPIVCGGTGLYIESILKGYKLVQVPENELLRHQFQSLSDEALILRLRTYRNLHNTTDTTERNRIIRAIEIQEFYLHHPETKMNLPEFDNAIFGIKFDRVTLRQRITQRLKQRLEEGMIEEVKGIINSGIKPEQLTFYGLEYKYITLHIIGEISYEEMFSKLNTAIHQFAKRQETWFRRMERQGFFIHWLPGEMPLDEKVELTLEILSTKKH